MVAALPNWSAIEEDSSGTGLQCCGQQPQQCGFTAAIGALNLQYLTRLQAQVQILEQTAVTALKGEILNP